MDYTEDDTFNKLKGVPFEEIIPEFMKNLNNWDVDTRIKYIYSKGWTIDDFNQALLQHIIK